MAEPLRGSSSSVEDDEREAVGRLVVDGACTEPVEERWRARGPARAIAGETSGPAMLEGMVVGEEDG